MYTPYDDKRAKDKYYYQEMKNVIIETSRGYDLRSKSNQETPKNQTSDKSAKNSLVNKPKTAKQKDKTVAANSDKNKEQGTQINEKQSADLSSASTSASAPIKTILTNINRGNQQIDFADKVAVNKAETNMLKNQMPFSLEQEISKIKIFVPLTN